MNHNFKLKWSLLVFKTVSEISKNFCCLGLPEEMRAGCLLFCTLNSESQEQECQEAHTVGSCGTMLMIYDWYRSVATPNCIDSRKLQRKSATKYFYVRISLSPLLIWNKKTLIIESMIILNQFRPMRKQLTYIACHL